MGALIGSLVVFFLLALLLLAMTSKEDRARALAGPAAIAVWFVYLIHADSVITAAWLDVGRVPVAKTPAIVVGVLVIVAGFALFAWSTRALVRYGDFEGMRARRLVVEGPYRFMRQPQNTGWAMMLLGIAIGGRSLIALGLVVLFAGFVALLMRIEERALAEDFGPGFELWREMTPVVGLPGRSGVTA